MVGLKTYSAPRGYFFFVDFPLSQQGFLFEVNDPQPPTGGFLEATFEPRNCRCSLEIFVFWLLHAFYPSESTSENTRPAANTGWLQPVHRCGLSAQPPFPGKFFSFWPDKGCQLQETAGEVTSKGGLGGKIDGKRSWFWVKDQTNQRKLS